MPKMTAAAWTTKFASCVHSEPIAGAIAHRKPRTKVRGFFSSIATTRFRLLALTL